MQKQGLVFLEEVFAKAQSIEIAIIKGAAQQTAGLGQPEYVEKQDTKTYESKRPTVLTGKWCKFH